MMTFDEVSKLSDVLARSLRARSPAIVATLVARDGHSYRDPGSMMVMTEALELVGGVSGGCLEGYIARTGRRLLRGRDSLLLSFDTATEATSRPTLGCGGKLDILVEHSRPDHLEYLDALAHAMQHSNRAAALVSFRDNGAFPDAPRARAVVQWHGFTRAESARRGEAVVASANRSHHGSSLPQREGVVDHRVLFGRAAIAGVPSALDLCEEAVELRECLTRRTGTVTQTASYIWPQPRLVIFGARDDAMPLVRMARIASWHVTVVDRRDRLASPERFPLADQLVSRPWPDAVAAIRWTRWTSAVLMTHSLEDDVALLPLLAARQIDYLGVLGPSARTQRLWDTISPEQRARIHSPVGEPLGEKSSAAVAVAIMAELIAHRRGRVRHAPQPAGKVLA